MSEFIVGKSRRSTVTKYHSDPDCRYVPDNHRVVDKVHVERRNLELCKVCAGENETATDGNTSALRYNLDDYES